MEEEVILDDSRGDDGPYIGVPLGVEVLMYVMYIVIAVTAIGSNGIVVYLIVRYPKMRTVTNFFIVNLAIGDILMACLCIPFGFVSNLLLQYWPFGSVMCILVSYSQAISVFISAYTLIAISIDRYIAVLNPLRPKMTKLQAKLIISAVWIVAILTPLPTALLSKLVQPRDWEESKYFRDKFICTEDWEDINKRYYYSMVLMILQYIFPLTVLIYTYARIARVVWGKQTPGEAEDSRDRRMAASKRKMIKMMIMCVMAFTLCWLPFNTLVVVGDQYPDIYLFRHINYVWFGCHFLAMSHACYNPFIYIWMNARFRAGFAYLLRPFPCIPRSNNLPDFLPPCNVTLASHVPVHNNGQHKNQDSPSPPSQNVKRTLSSFGTPRSLMVVIEADGCSISNDNASNEHAMKHMKPAQTRVVTHTTSEGEVPLHQLSLMKKHRMVEQDTSFIDSLRISSSSLITPTNVGAAIDKEPLASE